MLNAALQFAAKKSPANRREVIVVTWKKILVLFAGLLKPILTLISPAIKKLVHEMVLSLWSRALETENGWDDFFVEMLADILAIDLPPPE